MHANFSTRIRSTAKRVVSQMKVVRQYALAFFMVSIFWAPPADYGDLVIPTFWYAFAGLLLGGLFCLMLYYIFTDKGKAKALLIPLLVGICLYLFFDAITGGPMITSVGGAFTRSMDSTFP